jgi:putative membrane protein
MTNKTNRKTGSRLLTGLLSLLIILGFQAPGLQAMDLAPEKADQAGEKTEVIYGSLSGDGSLKDIYVVNRFEAQEGQSIEDYGDYTDVHSLSDQGSVETADGKQNVMTGSEPFYYQGKMENVALPWTFRISYKLDGQEMAATDLSGKSGDLSLEMEIEANQDAPKDNPWYENAMLQITVTLPGEVVRNLQTNDGQVSLAGSNQLINFLALPGQDLSHFALEVEVENFYMPSIQIAAVPFSLNLDDYTEDLPDISQNQEILDLQKGTGQLADGAQALAQGLAELEDGADKLQAGFSPIEKGGEKLASAGQDLNKGLDQFVGGLDQISGGSEALRQGLDQLLAGSKEFNTGLSQLSSKGDELLAGSKEIQTKLQQMTQMLQSPNLPKPEEIDAMVKQMQTMEADLQKLLATAQRFEEAFTSINQSAAELKTGAGEIKSKSLGVVNGLSKLSASMNQATLAEQLPGGPAALENQDVQMLLGIIGQQKISLDGLISAMIQLYGSADSTQPSAMGSLIDGLGELEAKTAPGSELVLGYAQFRQGLETLANSLGKLKQLAPLAQLMGGLNQLGGYDQFHRGLTQYVDGVKKLADSYDAVSKGQNDLASGVRQYSQGVDTLAGKSSDLKGGIQDYSAGVRQYVEGIGSFAAGFKEFVPGVSEAKEGADRLASGTKLLNDGVSGMDEDMKKMVDNFLEQYRKERSPMPSFVSDKNPTPKQVQFVLMTEEIPQPAPVVPEAPAPEKKTFWDRLLDLFR